MGRFLFVVETAELLNIFLIVLMALFLNAQGRAEFPVQILCFLMNRIAFQTFDVGCAGEIGNEAPIKVDEWLFKSAPWRWLLATILEVSG